MTVRVVILDDDRARTQPRRDVAQAATADPIGGVALDHHRDHHLGP
jgi:hypothetical protein